MIRPPCPRTARSGDEARFQRSTGTRLELAWDESRLRPVVLGMARLPGGLADDLREGYPLIAADARPWQAPRPTQVVDVLWAGG